MRRTLLGAVLALALFGPALVAQDDKPKPDQPTPADELKKLQTEVSTAQQEHLKAYKAAQTDEEREKYRKLYMAEPQKFARRALELAQEHAKDRVGHDAAVWMLRSGITGPELDKAADILVENHADKLGPLGASLARSTSPAADKILRAIVANTKEGQPRGQALFNLAQYLRYRADATYQANRPGAEKMTQEAEKLLEEVLQKHADAATLAKQAKGELFELRHLSVGKEAPEIDGEDTDAQKFKLSDYRGKVVLLDFWGHW